MGGDGHAQNECWDGHVLDAPRGKGWMEWELRWRAGVVHKDGQVKKAGEGVDGGVRAATERGVQR